MIRRNSAELNFEFPTLIDSTMRSTYVSCPTKFLWEWLYRLSPTEISTDLHAGGAFACALEAARRSYYERKESPEQALADGAIALIDYWGDFEGDEKNPKNLLSTLGALDDYFQQYPLQSDVLTPAVIGGKLGIEFTFAIPIPDTSHPVTGDPILYGGRADMIARMNNETLFICDEKTTKQLGPNWSKQWDMRGQFIGYTWAGRVLGRLPIMGTIVRGISFLKGDYGHASAMLFHPDWMIDCWLEQLSADVNRMKEDFLAGRWAQNFDSSCASYSGCPYQRLCLSEEPEVWMSQFYRRNTWNPLSKNPTQEVLPVEISVLAGKSSESSKEPAVSPESR